MHKKILAIGMILLLILINGCVGNMKSSNMPSTSGKIQEINIKQTENNLKSKFSLLSSAKTNFCAKAGFIASKSNDERLQGSCCSKMDFHRYTEQVEGLKKYSNIKQIPSDPYDIPVPLAKELLEFKKTIKLTSEQQAVYDEAMQMSDEHGPCCCKCWRWDAFEGLAKYLITEHNFNAQQIAEIWDSADGCGGKGHIEGMHA